MKKNQNKKAKVKKDEVKVKKNATEKVKKTNEEITSSKPSKEKKAKMYISYKMRMVLYFAAFIISFAICIIFATKTIEREKVLPIVYSTNGNINYKVYLNNNNYYNDDYLEMDRAYIASLINYIDLDYHYLFKASQKTNMNFDYKIVADLIIENSNGVHKYLEKKYTLVDTKTKKLEDSSVLDFEENVKIDYGYYNNLANSFRAEYGVDTNSYLNVYLEVLSKTDEDVNYDINETNRVNIKIPLSEKAIEIALDKTNQNTNKQVFTSGKVIFNKIPLIIEIIFFILTSYILSKIISYLLLLYKPKTAYDKYVNKILNSYDRLIVESKTQINLNDYNVTEVKSFNELLDVRDNLKLPIIYFNIVKHEKGIFYIKDSKDIYLITIKNVDLMNK